MAMIYMEANDHVIDLIMKAQMMMMDNGDADEEGADNDDDSTHRGCQS